MEKVTNNLVIAVHTLLVILLYLSPIWLAWWLIALLAVLNYLQIFVFGGCILTIKQLKSTEVSFQEWLLGKIGIKVNRKKFNRFLRWQLPLILLAMAILWQELLNIKPLV